MKLKQPIVFFIAALTSCFINPGFAEDEHSVNGSQLAEYNKPIIKNGFRLNKALVPPEDILPGGPPKDGIQAIDKPRFEQAKQNTFLNPDSLVLGVNYNNISRAYPIAILSYHEVVNDLFGDQAVSITYCPLCGAGVAYILPKSISKGGFGVSGLLYNSDVLLYDRETNSLWSQIMSQAISGRMRGQELTRTPLRQTTWEAWRREYPNTMVLTTQTGFEKTYDQDPYLGYEDSKGIWFTVDYRDPRFHPKERVIGIEIGKNKKVYPFAELAKTKMPLNDKIGKQEISVNYDPESHSAVIYDKDGKELPTISGYWFAWMAFNPKSEVFFAAKDNP